MAETETIKRKVQLKPKHYIIGTGLLLVVGLGIRKLVIMNNISNKATSELVHPRIHKADWNGLTFHSEIAVTNPTKHSITITKPVIYLTTNKSPLTNNLPESKEYVIEAEKVTNIDTIEMKLKWLQLVPFLSTILTEIPALVAAITAMDINAFKKAFKLPLEMYYTLYAEGFAYTSKPEKVL